MNTKLRTQFSSLTVAIFIDTCPGKPPSTSHPYTEPLTSASSTGPIAGMQEIVRWDSSYPDLLSRILPGPSAEPSSQQEAQHPESKEKEIPLRSLASLKWPYVPEESAYPDPLKRDDPKPLQLPQYEAIGRSISTPYIAHVSHRCTATSPTVRRVLASNPRLIDILRSIDALRGEERELALQEALGVGGNRNHALASLGHASPEDRDALRQLAEAVEGAVRGGKEGVLGLDWGD